MGWTPLGLPFRNHTTDTTKPPVGGSASPVCVARRSENRRVGRQGEVTPSPYRFRLAPRGGHLPDQILGKEVLALMPEPQSGRVQYTGWPICLQGSSGAEDRGTDWGQSPRVCLELPFRTHIIPMERQVITCRWTVSELACLPRSGRRSCGCPSRTPPVAQLYTGIGGSGDCPGANSR